MSTNPSLIISKNDHDSFGTDFGKIKLEKIYFSVDPGTKSLWHEFENGSTSRRFSKHFSNSQLFYTLADY